MAQQHSTEPLAKRDQAKRDQAKRDQAERDQAKPDKAERDQAKPGQAKLDRIKPDRAETRLHRTTRHARRAQQDHQKDDTPMRIIAGRHRGTKLALPAGAGTRPTADRTRESLFNILAGGRFGEVVDGAIIIDAFAGTGALGLEALSRGCAFASFIERDQQALAALRQNISRLDRADDSRVIAGDALTLARWHGDPATLLLADAPYGSGDGLAATQQLMRIGALGDDALIIIETGNDETMDADTLAAAGLELLVARRYGRALVHFLGRTSG
jgi:16S rRNA (guanine966-N2)-methyltransferase